MERLSNFIDEQVAPVLGLQRLDGPWASALSSSFFGRTWHFVQELVVKLAPFVNKVGTPSQIAGYLVMVALFGVIALPQFASEKDALALVVVAGFGLRLLGLLTGGRERFACTAVDAIVVAYFATNLVAACSSHYLLPSLKGLAKMCVYVGSYFFFTASLQHNWRRRSLTVLVVMLLLGLGVSLYGVYQYKIGVAPLATWEDPNVAEKTTRVYSTLRNPNLLAGYLVPMFPVAAALSVAALGLKGLWRGLSVVAAGTALVIGLALFFTGSRGGYIGLAVETFLLGVVGFEWLWQTKPKLRPVSLTALVLLPVMAAAIVHFALPSVESRFVSLFSGAEHSSNAYRLNVWKSSWRMFQDSWWFGIGPGKDTFCLAYGLYMRSGFDALGTYCVPLEVAVEGGIGALVAFGLLVVATMARAHTRFWERVSSAGEAVKENDWVSRWIVVGAGCGVAGIMAHGLGDTVFCRPQVQLLFWLLISIVISAPSLKITLDIGRRSKTTDVAQPQNG